VEEKRTSGKPAHASYFADPFVWRSGDEYYAIGTGPEEAEGGVPRSAQPSVFPLLRSLDLVEGRAAGHAMVMVDQAIPSNLITECDAGNRLLPNTKQ
jgi:hypothetical protein